MSDVEPATGRGRRRRDGTVDARARSILAAHDESGGPFSCPLGVLTRAREAGRIDPATEPEELAALSGGLVLARLHVIPVPCVRPSLRCWTRRTTDDR